MPNKLLCMSIMPLGIQQKIVVRHEGEVHLTCYRLNVFNMSHLRNLRNVARILPQRKRTGNWIIQ
jgi:hypothetical protein